MDRSDGAPLNEIEASAPRRPTGLRVVLVGCVSEGYRSLEHLIRRGENVLCVFTLQDELAAKTSGAMRFDDLTRRHGIPLIKVRNINDDEHVEHIRSLRPDVVFVIGWTQLVKPPILRIPRFGCIGFHASLLPRYRGRAPVNWAIINGERKTGNTMILLDEGVDNGDILAQREIPIGPDDTCATIYDRVAETEFDMLDEVLPLIREGRVTRRKQDAALATLMPKRRPKDGLVDWRRSAVQLHNWVRALTHPYPGAFTFLAGQKVYIWKASVVESSAPALAPGWLRVTGGRLLVGTGKGVLSLHRLQKEGEAELDGSEFAKRYLKMESQSFSIHKAGGAD